MNLGDLKLSILLDVAPFNQSIKTALGLLQMFKKNADDILKLKTPTFSSADFDSEITKLNTKLQQYSTQTTEAAEDTKRLEIAQESASTSSVRFADGMQNAFLRVQGFSSVLSVLKSTFGTLIDEYNTQEIALAKLQNGLKNVGEGQSSFNTLVNQAGELQKVTPFSDDQIENAQAMLTTFKKSSGEIELLTPRILDLAAAYMQNGDSQMDLQQVAVMLGKVNEDTIGTLKRVGVAFSKQDEETLKSLKGMEQAQFLAQILDTNFKGMAETVGTTAAGQMMIFKNKVGEVKESLGKIVVEAFLPFLTSLGNILTKIADAPKSVQVLTLGVLALAAAFTVLGSSMGPIPYAVGALITVFFALQQGISQTKEEIAQYKDELLRSQEVSEDFKGVLDELNISANNMAEAYRGIEASIIGMSNAQLTSAKLFIEAEIAKIKALQEERKQYTFTYVQSLGLSSMEAKQRAEQMEQQFTNYTEVGANLEKLNEFNSQIDAKMKFTPGEETNKKPTSTDATNQAVDNAGRESDAVDDLIKQWENLIKIYYSADDVKRLLNQSGKSELELIQDVNTELAKQDIYTVEQILKLGDYRRKLREALEKPVLTSAGLDEDLMTQINKDVESARKYWEEQSKQGTDRRFKPFDEIEAFRKSLQLRKELKGENISILDYHELIYATQSKINMLDVSNIKDLETRKTLLDDIAKYQSAISQIKETEYKIEIELQKSKIDLLDDEFERRRQIIVTEYSEGLHKLIQEYERTGDYSKYARQRETLDNKRSKQIRDLNEDAKKAFVDAFSNIINSTQRISDLLGIAANTFIAKLLNGMSNVIQMVQLLKSIIESITLINTLFSLAKAGAAIPFATGGYVPGTGDSDTVPILATPGELVIRKPRVRSLLSQFGHGFLAWLNGGGLFPAIAGKYAAGGIVGSAVASGGVMDVEVRVTGFKIKGDTIAASYDIYKSYLKSKRDYM